MINGRAMRSPRRRIFCFPRGWPRDFNLVRFCRSHSIPVGVCTSVIYQRDVLLICSGVYTNLGKFMTEEDCAMRKFPMAVMMK